MTFNTGNPIGSTDARDLSDNAENFDTAIGTIAPTWIDRLGVTRDSFEGRLAKGSFYRVGDFATGYTLTNMRQTLEYSGHEYSWAGTFPKVVAAGATPEATGGIGAGAWVDRTDVTLRGDLSASDSSVIIAGLTASQLALISTNGGINPVSFGAKPYPFDSSSAFASAALAAQSTRSPLIIPAGTWYTSPFSISLMHVGRYFLEKNCGVIGAGASNTKLLIKGSGPGYALNLNYPVVATTDISGFTLIPESTSIISGFHGLKITNCAWFSLHDVVINGFDTGLETEDVLSGEIRSCYLRENNSGAVLTMIQDSDGYNTSPNALTFTNCDFGSNKYFGLDINTPQVVNVIGGAIQGNGVALANATATTSSGGAIIRNVSREFGINFFGVYFEMNHGFADIYINDTETNTSPLYNTTVNTYGCMLFRQGNYLFWGVKHGVAITSLGNRKLRYNSFGDHFVGNDGMFPAVYANNAAVTYRDYGTVYSYESTNPWTASTSGTIFKTPRRTETIIINNITTETPTYEGTVKLNSITKEGTGVVSINLSNIDLFRYSVTASAPNKNVSCAVYSSTTVKFTQWNPGTSTNSWISPLHITLTPIYSDTRIYNVIG